MPKLKTNRSAAKRFRKTAKGRFKHSQAGRRHILSSKSAKRKRQLRGAAYVEPVDEKKLKRLLPY
jgi:large subunit ribosomal protein L35